MDERVLIAFAQWIQKKDEQLAQVPIEHLVQQVVRALQTEEGQQKMAPLFQQFQAESQPIFKKGGKMQHAVKTMRKCAKKNKPLRCKK